MRVRVVHALLNLQIGDSTQNVVIPIMDLVHPPSCYKFTVNRSEVNLRLVEINLYGNVFYATGITVYNLPLEFQIPLPDRYYQSQPTKNQVTQITFSRSTLCYDSSSECGRRTF